MEKKKQFVQNKYPVTTKPQPVTAIETTIHIAADRHVNTTIVGIAEHLAEELKVKVLEALQKNSNLVHIKTRRTGNGTVATISLKLLSDEKYSYPKQKYR